MSKLNLKQASLLDASGELSSPARHQLMAHISRDSAAQEEYRQTGENFAILQTLPIPEPSAAQRQFIPARIKQAIHRALRQPTPTIAAESFVAGWRLFMRYLSTGLALAACAAICCTLFLVQRAHDARLREQMARINAQIDRVAGASTPWPTAKGDQAITDIAASIRQLQTESPTLSDLHDKGLDNLLNALADLPSDSLSVDSEDPDFATPGSY
jgi:hypothetical protein